jgi:hypothetical protein
MVEFSFSFQAENAADRFRSLVRLPGCFVARFDRLRFRRVLLTQEDAEHDKECEQDDRE